MMRTIFAEYNPKRNSIDVYTSAGYMLRIDCWEAEKNLKTTPGSECALTSPASMRDRYPIVVTFNNQAIISFHLSPQRYTLSHFLTSK